MGDFSWRLAELQDQTTRLGADFLLTDLDLCFTFADSIQTELSIGDLEAAKRVLKTAEAGYASIAQLLPRIDGDGRKDEIAQRLTELRARLDDERRRIDDAETAREHS
jgi:hypothetical protein